METGLAYDDVLLVPQHSHVRSRSDVDTTANITPNITVDIPIISAPMDTVTEHEMAEAMAEHGAVGMIHRFLPVEEQAEQVEKVDASPVGATVGIDGNWKERADALVETGVDFLCLDVAHGHMKASLDVVETLAEEYPDTELIAGNVATGKGAADLVRAGADGVKVGIGPGSHCLTREVAGVGVPQFTAIRKAVDGIESLVDEDPTLSHDDVTVIADGGIRKSGDIVKALMAGADTVMIGGLFSGCEESPAPLVERNGSRYKRTHGMASEAARDENETVDGGEAVEGAESLTPYLGPVKNELGELDNGIRSGLSYCGGPTIEAARENAEFIRVTPNTTERNGTHGVADSGPE